MSSIVYLLLLLILVRYQEKVRTILIIVKSSDMIKLV